MTTMTTREIAARIRAEHTDRAAAARMRMYVLRLVAEAYDGCVSRGAVLDELGWCSNARDFTEALAQLLQQSLPDDSRHRKDTCSCVACSFFTAYDWDHLAPPLMVAAP